MKHTHKRIMSIFAAAALSVCSLPQGTPLLLRPAVIASAADSGTCGENLTWTYSKSTKTLTISGAGNMDDYDACLSLEPEGFYNPNKHRPWDYVDGDITKVVIEDGVNGIGAYAFYFQSVTEISIPDSVTTLSKSAFCGCDELTEITLPDSISEISDYAFEDCKILNKVTIKEGTAAIGEYAFWNCEELAEISLPDSLQSIGRGAFSNCTALAEINIPESVQHIGPGAFYNTAWQNAPSDEPLIIINGILYRCREPMDNVVQNIVVPDGVTFVNNGAFRGVGKIGSVTLPASVTEIDENAFYNCYGLNKVTISEGTTKIGTNAFAECSQLKEITIPKSVTEIGEDAIYADASMKIYGYKDSYAETYANENGIWFIALDSDDPFADYNYEVCEDGESIRILSYAGKEYDLTIPAEINELPVTEIGEEAFSDTDIYFNSIVVPDGIKRIGAGAFKFNWYLSEIDIPESVTEFGKDAFYCTKWLENKQAENPCVVVNGILIDGTTCEGNVTVPDGVKTIGDSAFMYNKKLTAVTIPDSVTAISDNAFYSCESLAEVALGKGLKKIGNSAFSSCGALTDIVLPEGLTEIGDYAFEGCSELKSVLIPNSVTAFGSRIFTAPFMGTLKNAKISGYAGSAAEQYAEENSIPFVSLGEPPVTTTTEATTTTPQTTTTTTVTTTTTTIATTTTTTTTAPKQGDASGTCGENVTWRLDAATGILTLSGTGKTNDWSSSEKAPWAKYRADIKKLVIAEGVTGIGDQAFTDCTALADVQIPDTLRSIGSYAFQGCAALKDVKLPWCVTSIGAWAFCKCTALESITILNYDCYIIRNPQTICNEVIDDYTQRDRAPFRGTIYGYSGSTADQYANDYMYFKPFSALTKPTSGTWGDNLTWKYENNTLTVSGQGDMDDVNGLRPVWTVHRNEAKKIVIADGITSIGANAFAQFSNATEIILPDSVRKIGESAFYDCAALERVTVSKNVESIGADAFGKCKVLTISGYAGSAAQIYAVVNDIPFEVIAETTTTTTKATTTRTTTTTTSTTSKPVTTAAKASATTVKVTTTTAMTTTTTKTTTTTAKSTTTTAKATTTTAKATTTTTKVTTTTKATTTTAKSTTTTAMVTTTTAMATTTAAPVTTTILTETTPVVTTSAAPVPLRGDVTRDGEVSVDDAQLTLKAYTERIAGNDMKLTAEQIKSADVNSDGEISVDDAQNILKYYTEKSVAGKDITWDDIFGKKSQSLPRLIRKRISALLRN